MRKAYPSDLTDEQWAIIEPLIPVNRVGRPSTNDMREVLNAIFYLRGYPVLFFRRKLLSNQEARSLKRRTSMPRCEKPIPPTSPTRNGPSSSR